MRILLHDYTGYAFPYQLARHLARAGHEVHFIYSASFQTPRGDLSNGESELDTLHVEGIDIGYFHKYSFVRRYIQELQYGRLLAGVIKRIHPDIVISADTPLEPQASAYKAARAIGASFVFWLQDVHSIAIQDLLRSKFSWLGSLGGTFFVRKEKRLLRASDRVIAISDDFADLLKQWRVAADRVDILENWAPLEELPQRPQQNEWSAQQGLDGKFTFVYSGTLGLKHNPILLADLARHFQQDDSTEVVVVSSGLGADWLKEQKKADPEGLKRLRVMDFQPYRDVPNVLASADVLISILEPSAGIFSVPSKVLAYLCAGRPMLLAVPGANRAARMVLEVGAGLVSEPDDIPAFLANADTLHGDEKLRKNFAQAARSYAETTFDIDAIRDRFLGILEKARASRT